jgi:6,7-dimethyl-8-ribityllumazine synthase
VAAEDILVVRVPGAFELPLVARRLANSLEVDCVLALGLVLKGETSHDEHIARTVAAGIGQVALETDTPVLFGVLTCATLAQARARALPPEQGGTHDKGREVARAALGVLRSLEEADAAGGSGGLFGFGKRERSQ